MTVYGKSSWRCITASTTAQSSATAAALDTSGSRSGCSRSSAEAEAAVDETTATDEDDETVEVTDVVVEGSCLFAVFPAVRASSSSSCAPPVDRNPHSEVVCRNGCWIVGLNVVRRSTAVGLLVALVPRSYTSITGSSSSSSVGDG